MVEERERIGSNARSVDGVVDNVFFLDTVSLLDESEVVFSSPETHLLTPDEEWDGTQTGGDLDTC